MIENKPSIYNQASIYNQGGGGGGGTFDVDIGGGVSQTLVFPPYLVPVEYIDSSNYTGSGLCIIGASQIARTNDYFIQTKIKPNKSKMIDGEQYRLFNFCYFLQNSTADYRFEDYIIRNASVGSVGISYAFNSHQFDNVDFDKELLLSFNCIGKIQKVQYVDGGGAFTHNDSRSFGSGNFGTWSFFNSFTPSNNYYHGKLYYSYVKTAEPEIKALWIPARAKDPSDTKPYIVDCVSGSVGVNGCNDLSTTGIEFGPDIDLSNEIPGWIT